MTDPDDARDAMLDRHAAALAEHFDSVIIITTRHGEGTGMYARGAGNFYAQLGSARDWVARQDAMNRRHAIETSRRDEDEED